MIVNEVFYTLQGEGFHAGRPAVFCRFARCNLWTGREQDRASAVCKFCDTDFLTGARHVPAPHLAHVIEATWPFARGEGGRFVVLTGGEPTLQVTQLFVDDLRERGFCVAMESNGTRPAPNVDWLTVSPKAGAPLEQKRGDEVKLVWPQEGIDPELYTTMRFSHRFIQPRWAADPVENEANVRAAVDYVLDHPEWKLSTQTHKTIGIR